MLTPAFRIADEPPAASAGPLKLAIAPTETPPPSETGLRQPGRKDVIRTWQHEPDGLSDLEEDEPETVIGLTEPLRPAPVMQRSAEVASQAPGDSQASLTAAAQSTSAPKGIADPLDATLTSHGETDHRTPRFDLDPGHDETSGVDSGGGSDPEPVMPRRPFWAAPTDEMARLEETIAELEAAVAASAEEKVLDAAGGLAEAGFDMSTLAAITRQAMQPAVVPRRLHLGAATVGHEIAQVAGTIAAEPDQSSLFDGLDDTIMDEAALRELVIEVIRQELQGALGERITRNVRKLVRAEIHRAMAGREFD